MKTATTLADATNITKADVFDLEQAYVDTVANTKRDDRTGVFHPSAVGMCARRNVYEYNAAPAIPTIEPEDLEIFDMGHAVHDLVQGKLDKLTHPEELHFRFQAEVKPDWNNDQLYIDYGIGGTTDGIMEIWNEIAGNVGWMQRGIVEVKSIKTEAFAKLSGPKPDHLEQAHIYAFRFGCPIIWIWYYNKNDSRRRVYTEVFDREVLMRALTKFQEQLKHAEAGTLPPRDESWWMCPRCAYREQCKPSVLGKIRGKDRKSSNKKLSKMRQRKLHRLPITRSGR